MRPSPQLLACSLVLCLGPLAIGAEPAPLREAPPAGGLPATVPASGAAPDTARSAPDWKKIDEAIARGVALLEKTQNKDGSWGTGTETHGTEIMSMVPGSHDAFRIGTTALYVM